jgi:GDPmannose 4,6-dehydratase
VTRVALVVGSRGQDGYYLTRLLQERGDRVIGLGRDDCDVRERAQVAALLAGSRPDEIYYLAGVFDSSEAAARDPVEDFRRSHEVHVAGWHHVLDAVERQKLPARLFYASSSRVFGDPAESPQTERTPLAPRCLYGITKRAGMDLARLYRQRGVFASCGILYNHESPRRPPAFVSRKVVQAAVEISRGAKRTLSLGNLAAAVDWGAAEDYVEAMTRMLALERPGDFVVASGTTHTVQQLVETAFAAAGVDWRPHVAENRSLVAAATGLPVAGDADRLRAATGWGPRTSFEEMIRRMVEAEKTA